MKAVLTGSKFFQNGDFTMIFFKILDTGKSAKTYTAPRFGNYDRWRSLLDAPKGTIISGFIMQNKNTIDADSEFEITRGKNVTVNTNYTSRNVDYKARAYRD